MSRVVVLVEMLADNEDVHLGAVEELAHPPNLTLGEVSRKVGQIFVSTGWLRNSVLYMKHFLMNTRSHGIKRMKERDYKSERERTDSKTER